VDFVARVESAMAARVSLRRNSPSYSDERKPSEALAACAGRRPGTAISGRSRNPTAYSGFKATRNCSPQECHILLQVLDARLVLLAHLLARLMEEMDWLGSRGRCVRGPAG
jgi:hypothetical protein